MNVTLRKRLKGKKVSLYLDYYSKGKRKRENLKGLFLYPENGSKLTKAQKEHNKEISELAEKIKAKVYLDIQNGIYGFEDKGKLKTNFILYMEALAIKRKAGSKSNYDNWDSCIKHLKKFAPLGVSFADITPEWLESFKDYLKNAQSASYSVLKKLSQNSQVSYFNKVRAALKEALREGIIKSNPCQRIKSIPYQETDREFLTKEELVKLKETECAIPILKNAFLFSVLTGLRFSDIVNLTWDQLQHSHELGYFIRYQQRKTKSYETLPISDSTITILGDIQQNQERIFVGLKYSAWHNQHLKDWMVKAGIRKKITFHCARHTHATLQLTLGTDLAVVQKLLGHKHIKTTGIYAKVIDQKKREAVNKIIL